VKQSTKTTDYGYTNEKVNDVCARIMRMMELTSEKENDSVAGLNIAYHGFVKAAYRLSNMLAEQLGTGTEGGIAELMRAITEMDNYVKTQTQGERDERSA
jgi:hypothetical protein